MTRHDTLSKTVLQGTSEVGGSRGGQRENELTMSLRGPARHLTTGLNGRPCQLPRAHHNHPHWSRDEWLTDWPFRNHEILNTSVISNATDIIGHEECHANFHKQLSTLHATRQRSQVILPSTGADSVTALHVIPRVNVYICTRYTWWHRKKLDKSQENESSLFIIPITSELLIITARDASYT